MTILADPTWHAHTPVIPAGNGYRTRVERVVHNAHSGSPHPYVVHQAYEYNGKWEFERGHYFINYL